MDHVIDHIERYMEPDKYQFIEEAKGCKNISDCPNYEMIKAYCDALRPLYMYLYGKDDIYKAPTPKSIISAANEL